ncbi:MAG: hypothetical protein OXE04_09525 [bacterium]|nr:hypothetical protein [bacterium]
MSAKNEKVQTPNPQATEKKLTESELEEVRGGAGRSNPGGHSSGYTGYASGTTSNYPSDVNSSKQNP